MTDLIETDVNVKQYPDAYGIIDHNGRIGSLVSVDKEAPAQSALAAQQACQNLIDDAVASGVEGAGHWAVRPITIGMGRGIGSLPEPDPARPLEEQGLVGKYRVQRVDGSDQPGGKHHGCRYFVLDMDHDPYAPVALGVYAAICEQQYPKLAVDLRERLGAVPASLSVDQD
mgnify:CR=1 FL=1